MQVVSKRGKRLVLPECPLDREELVEALRVAHGGGQVIVEDADARLRPNAEPECLEPARTASSPGGIHPFLHPELTPTPSPAAAGQSNY